MAPSIFVIPHPDTAVMISMSSLEFAHLVWVVTEQVGRLGWKRPGFRASPSGVRRLLRGRDGSVTVAVVTRGRSRELVLDDLIDGVLAVNFSVADPLNRAEARSRLTTAIAKALSDPEDPVIGQKSAAMAA